MLGVDFSSFLPCFPPMLGRYYFRTQGRRVDMVEVWLFSLCDFSVSEAQRCSSVEPVSGPSLCLAVRPGGEIYNSTICFKGRHR